VATYSVTGVRKVLSNDFSHRHIVGVCTDDGAYVSVATVAASIHAGHTWRIKSGGHEETIRVVDECPTPLCTTAPYIETNPRSVGRDNLENLDLC